MSFKIVCHTLFDITQTGVLNRARPGIDQDPIKWLVDRNTQCNFDTLLQVISLRSQPEVSSLPEKINIKLDKFKHFGFMLKQEKDEVCPCWKFEFEIQHPSVFDDGINELGTLYNDCDGIPMILIGTEWKKLTKFISSSPETRNIYFEVKENG